MKSYINNHAERKAWFCTSQQKPIDTHTKLVCYIVAILLHCDRLFSASCENITKYNPSIVKSTSSLITNFMIHDERFMVVCSIQPLGPTLNLYFILPILHCNLYPYCTRKKVIYIIVGLYVLISKYGFIYHSLYFHCSPITNIK